MKLDTLNRLFEDEVLDIYDAEKQLIKALPKMADASHNPQLRRAFSEHLDETKTQIERLETILHDLDHKPRNKSCKAMKGLVEEGNERVRSSGDEAVLDAGLIAAAQRVEHYEIAAYGCARTYASLLGKEDAAGLLGQSLEEEKRADAMLNKLAEDVINVRAVATAGEHVGT